MTLVFVVIAASIFVSSIFMVSGRMSTKTGTPPRKTKALTNYSPVELIRNTRLKKARQLLAQGEMNISQVAYEVGFTAPTYFTKCYKEFFGEMPNEMLK